MRKSKGLWTTKTHQNDKGEDFHYYYKDKVHQAIMGGEAGRQPTDYKKM